MYENIKTVNDPGSVMGVTTGFFKGLGISLIVTILIFVIAALLLSYTPLSEGAIPYIAFVTEALGALLSGFYTAKKTGRKGVLTGALSGFFYILIIWLIASLAGDGFYVGKHILTMLLASAASGAIGGILGVNLKSSESNKKRR